jgi:hypothetical protein
MHERVGIQSLWVKQHSLPLDLWSKRALTIIGNKMGRVRDIDEKIRFLDRTSIIEMNLGDVLRRT